MAQYNLPHHRENWEQMRARLTELASGTILTPESFKEWISPILSENWNLNKTCV